MNIPTEPIGSIPCPLPRTSTSRDTAFAKIRSRVLGTAPAAQVLGGR